MPLAPFCRPDVVLARTLTGGGRRKTRQVCFPSGVRAYSACRLSDLLERRNPEETLVPYPRNYLALWGQNAGCRNGSMHHPRSIRRSNRAAGTAAAKLFFLFSKEVGRRGARVVSTCRVTVPADQGRGKPFKCGMDLFLRRPSFSRRRTSRDDKVMTIMEASLVLRRFGRRRVNA